MYINRHKYFRWNRKTATIGFMYMVAIPSVVGYIGYKTEVSRYVRLGISVFTNAL